MRDQCDGTYPSTFPICFSRVGWNRSDEDTWRLMSKFTQLVWWAGRKTWCWRVGVNTNTHGERTHRCRGSTNGAILPHSPASPTMTGRPCYQPGMISQSWAVWIGYFPENPLKQILFHVAFSRRCQIRVGSANPELGSEFRNMVIFALVGSGSSKTLWSQAPWSCLWTSRNLALLPS